MALNPYSDLPAEQFWRKAVTNVPPFAVDRARATPSRSAGRTGSPPPAPASRSASPRPCGRPATITTSPRRRPPARAPAEAQARQFGTFSARYGNLYYARQFIQLFDRAYGRFTPELTAWERPDGRLVDPFRPTIEPAGFDSVAAIEAARAAHFAEVRRLFETLDVFVITLGLTEGFRWRADGAALPLAPGVAGGTYDPAQYDFVNAGAGEVAADLRGFLDRLWSVNPAARIIITVSPVPMIATYLDRHVMVSNSYSKSVLRAAAGEVCGIDDPASSTSPPTTSSPRT